MDWIPEFLKQLKDNSIVIFILGFSWAALFFIKQYTAISWCAIIGCMAVLLYRCSPFCIKKIFTWLKINRENKQLNKLMKIGNQTMTYGQIFIKLCEKQFGDRNSALEDSLFNDAGIKNKPELKFLLRNKFESLGYIYTTSVERGYVWCLTSKAEAYLLMIQEKN